MKLNPNDCSLKLSSELIELLEVEIAAHATGDSGALCLNFRDPNYSPTSGGFHPVEINIDPHGRIRYITDFAFVGGGDQVELAKELDFDFSLGLFQAMGRDYPIKRGQALFDTWQENFCAYHRMGVYQVSLQRV